VTQGISEHLKDESGDPVTASHSVDACLSAISTHRRGVIHGSKPMKETS
jgi:hypothetical protein